MNPIEYDKEFAVLSATPQHIKINSDAIKTDNLIHESGRLQLNTYQAFVRDFMNPQSDNRSLLLVHMTGTGKTISALATATEYVRQYRPNADTNSVASIVVLGFTKDIFKKELLSHPEFLFVNMDESKKLKRLELHMGDSIEAEEKYIMQKRLLMRRLVKREARGIYQFYGYREFAMRIINVNDIKTMMDKYKKEYANDTISFDAELVKKWIDNGSIRINTAFIKSLSKSLIICDEIHNLYKTDILNSYGLAISLTMDYFFKNKESIDYGCIRTLMLSATPLTSSALEIIPIITLLTGIRLSYDDLFVAMNGIDQLTAAGLSKIKQALSGYVSYIMDDNPREYPSSSFAGEASKEIDYLKFVRCPASKFQLKSMAGWVSNINTIDDKGMNMIKDITLPATKENPNGTIFGKHIQSLNTLGQTKAVHKLNDGTLASPIFELGNLGEYSSKYAKLVRMCIEMRGTEHGKIFIYHPYIQGSGTDMIIGIMNANGFLFDGDSPTKKSICMYCSNTYGKHTKMDHNFTPVCFTFITGSLSKTTISNRLAAFNNDMNVYGEKLKIIIGSRAMRESHTLKTCRHIIICHEPSSISEMIQIIGRAVRKNVHSMLPVDMQSVTIHILITYVANSKLQASTINEEESYRLKVLQFAQINRIDRLMYDISVDYLINFRFKQRETPPLLGEPYPLDTKAFNKYESILTKAYAETRNGVSLSGIHTSRFNVFYLDSEARLVVMIIKRILLDYQPLLSIAQIQSYVRDPPFHIEYNTALISDESIAMAIQRITFVPSQLQIVTNVSKTAFVDALFDQSSIVVDHFGYDGKIVCIGDPLCSDSYLTIRSISSIMDNDQSIIDSYRKVCAPSPDDIIDIKGIVDALADITDIHEILDDIRSNQKHINHVIANLPMKSNVILAEWAINNAADFALNKAKIDDLELVKKVSNFYKSRCVLFLIEDLETTRIYSRYKKYDTNTGGGWWSKNTKPSTAMLPIGHVIDSMIRLYQPSDKTWLSLTTIGFGTNDKHPFGWYIYEEKISNSLNVALKIRYENAPKTKGITLAFLQRPELEQVATNLKISVPSGEHKSATIDRIEQAAWEMQAKIMPKRVIYNLLDM